MQLHYDRQTGVQSHKGKEIKPRTAIYSTVCQKRNLDIESRVSEHTVCMHKGKMHKGTQNRCIAVPAYWTGHMHALMTQSLTGRNRRYVTKMAQCVLLHHPRKMCK